MEHKAFCAVLNKSCRGKTALYLFCSAARGLTLPATMLFTQRMIDSIVVSSRLACRYVLMLGLIFLADLLLFYSANELELLIKNRLEYDGGDLLLARCGSIKYSYYESGVFHQTIQELMNRYPQVFWERIRSCGFALQLAGSLVGIVYYLLPAGLWILCLLLERLRCRFCFRSMRRNRNLPAGRSCFPFISSPDI